jgi:hypothetical protein
MNALASTKEASHNLSRRSAESEWLDGADASPEELALVLRDLARFNGAMLGHWPVIDWLRRATKDAPKEKALTLAWHWLFLINVLPGLIACVVTPYLLPRKNTNFEGAKLDGLSLFLMAAALACLEIGLKQSPQDGWFSSICISLFSLSALTGGFLVWRTLRAAHPIVQLSTFGDRSFAIGCVLSFCFGCRSIRLCVSHTGFSCVRPNQYPRGRPFGPGF